MPQFRPVLAAGDARPLTDAIVRSLCAETTHRANFFAAAPLELSRDERPDEETFWELFHGRLLDGSQTRARRRFAAWNVFTVSPGGRRPAEPVIALKFDAAAGEVHVTRAILCHAHETYDAGGNVIQTREVQKWQRELVGTIRLADLADAGALRDELACRLFQAVVGVSRLPLTSIEAPLPGFTLGQLGYFHRPAAVAEGGESLRTAAELSRLPDDLMLAPAERVKHFELLLRTTSATDLDGIVTQHSEVMRGRGLDGAATPALVREVFNGVTLSPYTDFAPKAIAFVRHLEARGEIHITDRVDFLAHLVRQLGRHLAAYDLVTFHHRGANYPDALLLGELLDELLPLAEQVPDLFADAADNPTARLRRRAIRQGALLRAEYTEHPVPDAPTSPGENLRVLPEPFVRVPEDQIHSPIARRRQLFADGRFQVSRAIRDAFADLDYTDELRELGTALFLDRPLGGAKAAGEPDQTLLMSHVLFSRSLAQQRLRRLARRAGFLADPDAVKRWQERLRTLPVDGLPLAATGPAPRPGVVSLHDALRVDDDFLLLRTTRQTLRDFQEHYDTGPLVVRLGEIIPPVDQWRLLIPGGTVAEPLLQAYDGHLRLRLELAPDLSHGYATRGGAEFPAAGLRVLRAWGMGGAGIAEPLNLRRGRLTLLPRR